MCPVRFSAEKSACQAHGNGEYGDYNRTDQSGNTCAYRTVASGKGVVRQKGCLFLYGLSPFGCSAGETIRVFGKTHVLTVTGLGVAEQ